MNAGCPTYSVLIFWFTFCSEGNLLLITYHLRTCHSPKHDTNGLSDMTTQDNCISREQSIIRRTGQPSSAQNFTICMSLISYINIKSMPLCWEVDVTSFTLSPTGSWSMDPQNRTYTVLRCPENKLGSHKDTEPATSPYERYSMN